MIANKQKNILFMDIAKEDHIIKMMFINRTTSQDDVDPEAENERRRRLHSLLKSSRKYRRLSVKLANDKWGSYLEDSDINASSSSSDDCHVRKLPQVRFSESIQIIPEDTQKKESVTLIKSIRNIFRLKKS